ncbi:H-type small acid-soluble spore protein [Brevibacillus brevis]|uniref:H-type small acid-soluble spore protein n=1 Tax=Brevibacillus brevis TaxID=1393 RepID=A0ABY9T2Q1_BREBE|nr:H-type small acid-soluble spore protein [Brevibacillus brevis]WNC14390.1 H-type small acid-soluble spore protein [Brevibacillus brevis]
MDLTRAREIVRSEDKIVVHYKGDSVWIDELDESTATARVHTERNPASSLRVEVEQLEER